MGGPERFKTYGNVFDEFTRRNLFRLESQGFFQEVLGPVSIGKEANIFSAKKDDSLVAIKIYRLENCNFNRMWQYLASDPRYKNTKPQRRQIIFAWVQREFRNLLKAREAGVRVPTPIHFSNNIILEEFIGHGNKPCPQLNKAALEDPQRFYEELVQEMTLLEKHAHLVHADLSPFNILIQQQHPVLIDMSQSTASTDPNAEEYRQRDIRNIATFFRQLGIDTDEEKLRHKVFKD